MERVQAPDASVSFVCAKCKAIIAGGDEDTLWAESTNTGRGDLKHEIFLSRAAHDLSASNVPIKCADCGRAYMALVRIGQAEKIMYVCKCGARVVPTGGIGKK